MNNFFIGDTVLLKNILLLNKGCLFSDTLTFEAYNVSWQEGRGISVAEGFLNMVNYHRQQMPNIWKYYNLIQYYAPNCEAAVVNCMKGCYASSISIAQLGKKLSLKKIGNLNLG